jgi:hypothetical protein
MRFLLSLLVHPERSEGAAVGVAVALGVGFVLADCRQPLLATSYRLRQRHRFFGGKKLSATG